MILTIIVVLVLAILVIAFVTDYRDRKNGIKTASAKQIAENVRTRKRETRTQLKTLRRGFGPQNPGPGRQSPGGSYLGRDDGPPRRGR